MRRHIPYASAAVAVLAVAACTLAGGCDSAPDAVDHRQMSRATAPLADTGPPSGTYREAWHTGITTDPLLGPPSLVRGSVVVGHGDGLQAYDGRTGTTSWHYREPGREMQGYAVTGDAVVAQFHAAHEAWGTDPHLVGIDPDDGKLLWQSNEPWGLTSGGRAAARDGSRPDSAGGVVPVTDHDGGKRAGLDARTGEKRWQLSRSDLVDDRCRPGHVDRASRGRGDVLPVLMTCGDDDDRSVPVVLDAGTGRVLWTREAGGYPPMVTSGSVAVAPVPAGRDDAPVTLVGRDGRTLFTDPQGEPDASRLLAGTRRVVLTYPSRRDNTSVLAAVNPVTGASAKRTDPADPVRGTAGAVAGDRLYLESRYLEPKLEDRLLPAGLTVVDVATMRSRYASLPYTDLGFHNGETLAAPPRLVAVAGGRLFTVSRSGPAVKRAVLGSYVLAETRRPTVLGGVPARDWPDPCRLLAGVPHAKGEDDPPHPGPRVSVRDTTVRSVECRRYHSELRVL